MSQRLVLIAATLIAACGISGMPRPPSSNVNGPNGLPTTRPATGDPNMVPSLPPGNTPATAQQLTGNPSQPSDAGFAIPLAPPPVDAGPGSP